LDIRIDQEASFRNQAQRSEARRDLRDTLSEVSVRIERAESDLRPDHLIQAHVFGASIAAGALGFFLGSKTDSWLTGPVMVAALLTIVLVKRSATGRDHETKPAILSH
jgi:hypothetical protein